MSYQIHRIQWKIFYFIVIFISTKLCIVMHLISDVFGWSMITFLAQFCLHLINLSYWIYINSTMVESWKINFCMPNCCRIALNVLMIIFYFRYFLLYDDDFKCLLVLLYTLGTLQKIGMSNGKFRKRILSKLLLFFLVLWIVLGHPYSKSFAYSIEML